MPTGTLSPSPKFTALDDAGDILPGALLYTYLAGTTTPATTYQDSDLTTPNANPVECDASGRAVIYLEEKSYKFILKDADGNTIWTQDNISAVNLGQSGGLGEIFVFGGNSVNPIRNTSYPTGDTFDKIHDGTAVYQVDSAELVGTYVLEAILKSGDGTTVVSCALVNLDDGAPNTPLVAITSDSSTGEIKQSSAITFAAAGTAKKYGIKVKVDTGYGVVWGARLVRTN